MPYKDPVARKACNDRMRREKSEQYAAAARRRELKRKFNLTVEQYEDMLAAQGGVCAICRKPPNEGKRLAVDHCHKTNKVRGLLHGNCNRGVGLLGDDPVLLRAAAEYLEK